MATLENSDSYSEIDNDSLRSIATTMSQISPTVSEVFPKNDPRFDPKSDNFDPLCWAKRLHDIYQSDSEQLGSRALGISFKDLTVVGRSQDEAFQVTTGNLLYALAMTIQARINFRSSSKETTQILKPMDGLVIPGEMVVVLGRPGAGCTTFLRTIASRTYGFTVDKKSEINYSGIDQSEIRNHYRGDVTYCAETETHFPTLTVGQTLMFAAKMKTPRSKLPGITRSQYAQYMRDVYMAMLGLSATVNTHVGDDFKRGVSGGERKRVSIAELALSRSVIQCWDNSTRGLDAATALEFIRVLRICSDNFRTTTFLSIYQASQAMYDLFDKVQLLYEGYQIYYGPIGKAQKYFYEMGWQPKPRQTTPDFLTSLTQPDERVVRRGYEKMVPQTAAEFYERWRRSDVRKQLIDEIEKFNNENPKAGDSVTSYRRGHRAQQSHGLPPKSSYTVNYGDQIKALIVRGYQRYLNDPTYEVAIFCSHTVISLVIGSLFYNMQGTTGTFYGRTAMVFFALLFNAFHAQTEIFALYATRPVTMKHNDYAFYHPAVEALSAVIIELPNTVLSSVSFNIILYFLANLRREPGNFFFFLFLNFVTEIMMSFFFRTIGGATPTLQVAMVPAGVLLFAMTTWAGFVIPMPRLHGTWSRWITYINPLYYAYEALMTNEFHNRYFECSEFIPSSQFHVGSSFTCSAVGSIPGETTLLGDRYLEVQYEFTVSHQWRNLGFVFAFTAFFLFTYMLVVYLNPGLRSRGEVLVYPMADLRRHKKEKRRQERDKEAMIDNTAKNHATDFHIQIAASNDVFYWSDVCYDVKVKGGTRRLLNKVDGWVMPGTLTALMGATGAGKTTLLNVLASRVDTGVVQGEFFVNGQPRDSSFTRTTGYAMQQDLHLQTTTVREALEFSALMRQSWSTPRKEKLSYVDNILNILDMKLYEDAVVGVPGKGLNVEQRKRLTIGVELVAKPQLLLFLDEPTSGLDSQTSWSILQLLKKLSAAGQAILCTIHQPSALLLQEFDRLLFLAKGGHSVYFGDIGENSKILVDYFVSKGADPCPENANPADWMLEVVGAAPGSVAKHDYGKLWLESEEHAAVLRNIERLKTDYKVGTFEATAPDSGVSSSANNPTEFAAPFWYQSWILLLRSLQLDWRSPFYLWSKFGMIAIVTIVNGFAFFYSDTSLEGMQNLMYSVFQFTSAVPGIMQHYVPYFKAQRMLYEARERPSKVFSWQAFIVALIVAEFPWQTVSGLIAFFCYYYPAGLYKNASLAGQLHERGGLAFFYVWIFYQYGITFGQMIMAGIEDDDTASVLAMSMFVMCQLFCGVLSSKDAMPGFWKFMYRVSPFTYWIGGMLALAIANVPVVCSDYEYVVVYPPSGESCQSYFSDYLVTAAGYLGPDNSDGSCNYCTLQSTNEYLSTIAITYDVRWRYVGYLFAFIAFNMGGCIFMYWLMRVPNKLGTRGHKSINGSMREPSSESSGQSKEQIESTSE